MLNRLRLKITLGTAVILGSFLLILGMYIINSQEEQLVQNLRDHGNRIAALAARSSAEYIQRFSFFLMEDQAISIEQSPNIAFCEIYDANGVSLLQSGNIVSEDHDQKHKARYDEGILVVTHPILADGKMLGSVEIGLRLDSIAKAMRDKTARLTFLFLSFTLSVIFALNIFLHRLFIKPILSLAKGAKRVAKRDFAPVDVGHRDDEIGLLVENFNTMSLALQGLYDNLERKVRERTEELEQANSDLKAAVDRAREMAKKAEAGTLAKSQFLASMSHEIRTPMNAVLGMGEVLERTDLNSKQKRYVSILLESGNALLNLINDILDFSKIEAGEMGFENAAFNLESVVDRAFKVTAFAGYQKGLDLDYFICSDVPMMLRGDSHRLQQILTNLLGNGIKFTQKGHVLLNITVADPALDDGRVMLHFCVKDSGAGIPSDKLKTIFDKFTQADASTTRQQGGTGLGLTICRLLCGRLGGCIWIESELGKGSSIHFELPYQVERDAVVPVSPFKNQRIVLIDSREYVEETLAARLVSAGADIVLAEGAADVQRILSTDASCYDGVFINAFNRSNGWENAVLSARELGVAPEKMVLLRPGDAERVADVPTLSPIVTSPASVRELAIALGLEDIETPSAEIVAQCGTVEPGEGLDILLVEDSVANSMLIELYLKDSNHRLHVANNGVDGVDLFRRNPIDIVFMDIEMPVMDGLECTRLLREWEREHRTVPARIVALTAHALVEIKEKALSAGCDSFLTKPIRREDFIRSVGSAKSPLTG